LADSVVYAAGFRVRIASFFIRREVEARGAAAFVKVAIPGGRVYAAGPSAKPARAGYDVATLLIS
jgi:hypothetical protein